MLQPMIEVILIRLLIDMDEVICDFLGELCKRFNRMHSTIIGVDCFSHYDLTYVIGESGRKIFLKAGFFNKLKAFPDSIAVLKDMHDQGHDILIVTDALGNPDVAADKSRWVEKHFPFLYPENFIMTSRKDLIKADLMFEDSPCHLESFDGVRVVMDRPYNRHVIGHRIYDNSWADFHRLVNSL